MNGAVFDTGALIAIDRHDRRIQALLARVAAIDGRIIVPAAVLAQAWRDGRRQARLATFLRDRHVDVVPLDTVPALATGVLCGRSRTSDVVDASVVVTAHQHGLPVVTSDPGDLKRLDPTLEVHRV